MALADDINPTDSVLQRLSAPREAEEMPKELRCPAGHRAYRQTCRLEIHREGQEMQIHDIPVWLCPRCLVGYRYAECALIPGEEGHV